MTLFLVPFHLDEPLAGFAVPELEGGRVLRAPLPDGGIWVRLAALYQGVADAVCAAAGRGQAAVVASGDCTTSLGVLAGLQRAGIDPGIVWFDAHGDFNTDETTPSGYAGGMPLAIAVGRGDQTAPRALGMRAIDEGRVVLVDARDLDPLEREALDRSRVRRVEVAAVDPAAGGAALPDGPLYLHLDIDVLDPPELPGLRYPSAGGVSRDALARAVAGLLATGRVMAIGLGCTWWPDRVDAAAAARVLRQVLPRPAE
jgi:arginase